MFIIVFHFSWINNQDLVQSVVPYLGYSVPGWTVPACIKITICTNSSKVGSCGQTAYEEKAAN